MTTHLSLPKALEELQQAAARHSRMMRLPEVMQVTGLGRSTIYAQMTRGEFPQPVKLGARAVAWPETAIAEWLANRPAARAA